MSIIKSCVCSLVRSRAKSVFLANLLMLQVHASVWKLRKSHELTKKALAAKLFATYIPSFAASPVWGSKYFFSFWQSVADENLHLQAQTLANESRTGSFKSAELSRVEKDLEFVLDLFYLVKLWIFSFRRVQPINNSNLFNMASKRLSELSNT